MIHNYKSIYCKIDQVSENKIFILSTENKLTATKKYSPYFLYIFIIFRCRML